MICKGCTGKPQQIHSGLQETELIESVEINLKDGCGETVNPLHTCSDLPRDRGHCVYMLGLLRKWSSTVSTLGGFGGPEMAGFQ